MIRERLQRKLGNRRCTLLGVGPMSKNCVDAAIEIANGASVPLLLIASRRQIDSLEFDGGYVENWDTESYAKYVRQRDKRGLVLLARDHGGPWQNPQETRAQLGLQDAIESCKRSYAADIEAGFQILHIDPSVDIHGRPTAEDVLDRIYELYEFCWNYAQRLNREVIFEIGTEEQSGSTNTQDELISTLESIRTFVSKNRLPSPTFVVIQAGTRVMETRNVGSFDSPIRVAEEIPAEIQLPKMIEICDRYGILMKEHNTDYLSDEALQWHPRLGIHSANVAPEFGVAETRALLEVCDELKLRDEADEFCQVSLESRKWEKWMLPNTTATDKDRAVISGHYVFSDERVIDLKNRVNSVCLRKGFELDARLREAVAASIMRYVRHFRLV